MPHRPISLATSPIPNLHYHLANPLTTSPILPRILANLPCTLAKSPLPRRQSSLPSSLSLHTLRAPISTLLRRCSQRPVQRPRRVSKEPAARRGRQPHQALFVERPHLWGSGLKGKWASVQGRMGGAAADRDNVCGEVSHAAIWVGGAMRVGGGLCVAAGWRRGPTDAPTPRAVGWWRWRSDPVRALLVLCV